MNFTNGLVWTAEGVNPTADILVSDSDIYTRLKTIENICRI